MAWLPNLLTIVRILLTPFIVRDVLDGHCGVALPFAMFAGFTDAADGYVARLLKSTSRTGAWLDPVADKFLLTGLYLSFGYGGLAPWPLVWLVVGRDALILAMVGTGLLITSIRDFPPTIWGKICTVVQIAGALILLASCSSVAGAGGLVLPALVVIFLATGWSGVHYVWRALVLLRSARQKV
ncbi:MAG: CDP-alcohol phosphatidyltransferase family protein [Bryobacteraceae bacterium]|nr:CDP-alcohol phosphatidyltransferase family protein [Bryobacteraceae bacterium]